MTSVHVALLFSGELNTYCDLLASIVEQTNNDELKSARIVKLEIN